MTQSKIMHGVWLVLAVLLLGGMFLLGYLDQSHYFPHSKVIRITSRAWDNHQRKECTSWNAKSAEPILECDDGHSELTQTVPVRFYGDIRRELQPETLRLHWTCEKKEESQPAISCRIVSQP